MDEEERASSESKPIARSGDETLPGRPAHVRSFLTSSSRLPRQRVAEDYFMLQHQERRGEPHGNSRTLRKTSDSALRKQEPELPARRPPMKGRRANVRRRDRGWRKRRGWRRFGRGEISSAVFLPTGCRGRRRSSPRHRGTTKSEPGRTDTLLGRRLPSVACQSGRAETDDEDGGIQDLHLDDKDFLWSLMPVFSCQMRLPSLTEPETYTPKSAVPLTPQYEDHIHEHQWQPKQPLDAIELIPYKHQVGGHTTLWRFSKKGGLQTV